MLVWSVVWFQNKLHSTQFNYHYLHTYICICMCWYKIEWFKALKYINIIIEHLYRKSETFHSTWCTKPSWMGRWVINGLTIELCHLFRLGFFRNDNNNIPCICSFHCVFIVAECGTGQSIINVILLTSAGVLCLSIIWKESKIGLCQSFHNRHNVCLWTIQSILPPNLHPVPSVHTHHKYFLFQDYLGLKNHEKR